MSNIQTSIASRDGKFHKLSVVNQDGIKITHVNTQKRIK